MNCLGNVPMKNQVVYTEGPVACYWAGPVTRPFTQPEALTVSLLIVSIARFRNQRPTDRRTDQPTEWLIESRARD